MKQCTRGKQWKDESEFNWRWDQVQDHSKAEAGDFQFLLRDSCVSPGVALIQIAQNG
jgi:hypothetical protein